MSKPTLSAWIRRPRSLRHSRPALLRNTLLVGLCLLTWHITAAYIFKAQSSTDAGTAVDAHDDRETRALEPGKPVERTLKGGESHSYQIPLTVGQYLHVIADQQGIDVQLKLFAPDGKQLLDVDSPNGTQGPESLSVIAETTGIYRLEVRSLEANADQGRYGLRVEEIHAATDRDRARVETERRMTLAQRTFDEAEQLRNRRSAESLRAAIAKYKEAVLLFRSLDNRGAEALGLSLIGGSHDRLGEIQEALEYYNLALSIFRTIGNKREEGIALNNIGLAYSTLGKRQEALDHYRLALPVHKEAGNRNGEATTLQNIGLIYAESGDNQQAVHYYNEALEIARAVRDRNTEASTLNLIGVLHATEREYQKALECYNLALSLDHESGDRQGEAITLQHLGDVYRSSGDLTRSLEYLNRALEVEQAAGDRRSAAFALSSIGEVLRLLGDKQKALEKLKLALAMSREIRSPEPELRALAAFARTYRDLGMLAETREHIESALELSENLRTRVGSRALRASSSARAQANYEFYIDFLMSLRVEHPEYAAEALKVSERARARGLLELLSDVGIDSREGADSTLLARERELQMQLDEKAVARTSLLTRKHTEGQAALADKEVYAISSQLEEVGSRIRSSNPAYTALMQPQPLNAAGIQQMLDADTTLLEYALGTERSYLWAVTQTSISSYTLPPRAEIESAARKVYRLLIAQQPNLGPRQAQRGTPEPAAAADYERQAAALSQMLLSPIASELGARRLVIVAPGALQYLPFAVLPEPKATAGFERTERQKGKGSIRSQSLSTATPLIVAHEIVSLPSASVLSVLRREVAGRQPARKTIAVLADPVFARDDPRVVRGIKETRKASSDQAASRSRTGELLSDLDRAVRDVRSSTGREGLARLPFSREEAEAILAVTSGQASLKALDFRANRETATGEELGQYRVVHFATHGLLDAEHPELSGLVLSLVDRTGQTQNGFLRLHEIYNLHLPAEVVVLSACETGLGKDMKGEGLVGLTRGFMHAGAARVVASLWQVDDIATAQLMKRFYRGMFNEGLTPAAALRAAQVDMWKHQQWQAPYYWGGFVLQGEWR